jgi:hypothetical protein
MIAALAKNKSQTGCASAQAPKIGRVDFCCDGEAVRKRHGNQRLSWSKTLARRLAMQSSSRGLR